MRKPHASLTGIVVIIIIALCAPADRARARQQQSEFMAAHARSLRDSPRQQDADDFERGKLLLSQGDASGAAAYLKRAAEARKTDADAWHMLGVALGRAGNHKDASKAFEKAIKLRPGDAGSRAGRAYSLLMLGKLRDAERESKRALDADARNSDAHYVLGVVRFNENKFEEAESEAETALALKPDALAAAYLAADSLLNVYTDVVARLAHKYPMPHGASAEERKAVDAKRDPEYEPLRARLRALADRAESAAASDPSQPGVTELRDQIETLRFYGRPGGPPAVMNLDEVSTKAVITYKPEPSFTEVARQNNTTGTVRLRAVLTADGRVTHIIPLKRLPDGLTERCIEVARRIRFEPATLDGKPVSQFVLLEYDFKIY